MWASPLPAKKPGSLCLVGSLRTPSRCPRSVWNAVRHHGGMLSAIRAERCPRSRGIRSSCSLRACKASAILLSLGSQPFNANLRSRVLQPLPGSRAYTTRWDTILHCNNRQAIRLFTQRTVNRRPRPNRIWRSARIGHRLSPEHHRIRALSRGRSTPALRDGVTRSAEFALFRITIGRTHRAGREDSLAGAASLSRS